MYAQVDADGYVQNMMEEILDYKKGIIRRWYIHQCYPQVILQNL